MPDTDPTPTPTPTPEESVQRDVPKAAPQVSNPIPASGRRLAFQDLKRTLSDKELANPGTQKLILEMLTSAEIERDELKAYVPKYYEAEKRSCVLEANLRTNRVNEVLSSVCIGAGGTIVGLAPFFWEATNARGQITLIVGAVFIIGGAIGRIIYK